MFQWIDTCDTKCKGNYTSSSRSPTWTHRNLHSSPSPVSGPGGRVRGPAPAARDLGRRRAGADGSEHLRTLFSPPSAGGNLSVQFRGCGRRPGRTGLRAQEAGSRVSPQAILTSQTPAPPIFFHPSLPSWRPWGKALHCRRLRGMAFAGAVPTLR